MTWTRIKYPVWQVFQLVLTRTDRCRMGRPSAWGSALNLPACIWRKVLVYYLYKTAIMTD